MSVWVHIHVAITLETAVTQMHACYNFADILCIMHSYSHCKCRFVTATLFCSFSSSPSSSSSPLLSFPTSPHTVHCTPPDPIDLTQEDNALQKTLALSLQEMQQGSTGGPQISLEDQELSR